MKKRLYIIIGLLLIITVWIFSGNIYNDTKNLPIKKRIQTTGIFLFGMRKIWTVKTQITTYNRKGQKIEDQFFENNDEFEEKYIYEYNEFDSLKKVVYLIGYELTPSKFEIYKYDNFHRPIQQLFYEISGEKKDTFMYESKSWKYDIKGRKFKTIFYTYNKENPTVFGIMSFVDVYNDKDLVVSDTFITPNDKHISNYNYDKYGHKKTKFDGLMNEYVFYKTNKKGQIIEEMSKSNDFISDHNKYWYDKNGNKLKTVYNLGTSDEHTYTFKYDKNNRILKEKLSGNFLYLFMAFNEYSYEYFE